MTCPGSHEYKRSRGAAPQGMGYCPGDSVEGVLLGSPSTCPSRPFFLGHRSSEKPLSPSLISFDITFWAHLFHCFLLCGFASEGILSPLPKGTCLSQVVLCPWGYLVIPGDISVVTVGGRGVTVIK